MEVKLPALLLLLLLLLRTCSYTGHSVWKASSREPGSMDRWQGINCTGRPATTRAQQPYVLAASPLDGLQDTLGSCLCGLDTQWCT